MNTKIFFKRDHLDIFDSSNIKYFKDISKIS